MHNKDDNPYPSECNYLKWYGGVFLVWHWIGYVEASVYPQQCLGWRLKIYVMASHGLQSACVHKMGFMLMISVRVVYLNMLSKKV